MCHGLVDSGQGGERRASVGRVKCLSRTESKRDSALRSVQVASANKVGAHREHTSAG